MTCLQAAVATALPTIAHDLHAEEFAWIGNSYALSSTALLLLSGGLAEVSFSTLE